MRVELQKYQNFGFNYRFAAVMKDESMKAMEDISHWISLLGIYYKFFLHSLPKIFSNIFFYLLKTKFGDFEKKH